MTKTTDRMARWNEAAAASGRRLQPVGPAPKAPTELERAEAAVKGASLALAATNAKLQRLRHTRQGTAALRAVSGTLGVVGFISIAIVSSPSVSPFLIGLFALACAVPILSNVQQAILLDVKEVSMVTAVENARALVTHAVEVRDVLSQAPQNGKTNLTEKSIVSAVMSRIEQSAAVAPGREDRLKDEGVSQSRRHLRIKPLNTRIVVTRSDGLAMLAELVDVSLSGAAVVGDLSGISLGDEVLLGSKKARVVRDIADGCGCEFVVPLAPQDLDFDIIL